MSLLQTFFNSEVMLDSLPALLRGLRNTLVLSLFSILCGVVLGLVVCLIRLYAPLLLRAIAIVYIDLFRAMPMLVILILIYYALPFLGVHFTKRIDGEVWAGPNAVLALARHEAVQGPRQPRWRRKPENMKARAGPLPEKCAAFA